MPRLRSGAGLVGERVWVLCTQNWVHVKEFESREGQGHIRGHMSAKTQAGSLRAQDVGKKQ